MADFMFDIHFQAVRPEKRFGLFEYLQKLPCRKPMIHVLGNPSLQATHGLIPQRATAIHEPFVNSRYFRDMGMSRNGTPIWQNKTDIQL